MAANKGSNAQSVPTPERCEAQFELGITLSLFLWPSLTLAVTNNWGGPDAPDKREWLAQETIDQLKQTSEADADVEWLEEFLINAMMDNFDVAIDDESCYEVAEQIVRLRKDCGKGNFGEVEQMKSKWESKAGREDVGKMFEQRERNHEDDETDASEDDDEDGMDVDMDEAPPLVTTREPFVPQVDEDGFTKVTKKKR